MISANSSDRVRLLPTSIVSWNASPGRVGGMPTWPAATYAFCDRIALMTSLGMSERCSICCGSSQIRMLYWPMPKTVTSPTPGTRASLSWSWSVAKLERKRASYRPPAAVSVTICRIAVDFFFVTTPCCCTDCGSCARAADTRFWTSTWARSRSVPTWNVTISVYRPSDVQVDCM